MINITVLLTTGLLSIYVIFRAVLLNQSLPWFGLEQGLGPEQGSPRMGDEVPSDTGAAPAAARGWRARAVAAGRRGGAG